MNSLMIDELVLLRQIAFALHRCGKLEVHADGNIVQFVGPVGVGKFADALTRLSFMEAQK